MDISVVIPVYGCPSALCELHKRLTETLNQITSEYEIILVNDACPKNSWKIIKELCEKDSKVKGINLSRNFGQVHATNAGLDASAGDMVVLMDCDLQDRPEGILQLYNELNNGYDVVFARRKDRKDSGITIMFSRLFYYTYNKFVDGFYDGGIGNFCIAKRKVVDEYCAISENNKSYTTVLCWMGYESSIVDIAGDERYEGKSSYNFRKKLDLAIDMLTSQSNKPLKLCIRLGLLIALLSIVYLTIRVIMYFVSGDIPMGWTSTIASIFFMGGTQLMFLGVVGIYIGNIFNEVKGRPEYLVSEKLNFKES